MSERRGTCPDCGRGVYTYQDRWRDEDGSYFHQGCGGGNGSGGGLSDMSDMCRSVALSVYTPGVATKANNKKVGTNFENWIEERLVPQCEALGLTVKSQYRQRDGESIPDFVVYSRGGSSAVIIDAKHYGSYLGANEVHKLRRDMDILRDDEGVSCIGLIYHISSTKLSSATKEAAGRDIYFISQDQMHPQILAKVIYGLFYE